MERQKYYKKSVGRYEEHVLFEGRHVRVEHRKNCGDYTMKEVMIHESTQSNMLKSMNNN